MRNAKEMDDQQARRAATRLPFVRPDRHRSHREGRVRGPAGALHGRERRTDPAGGYFHLKQAPTHASLVPASTRVVTGQDNAINQEDCKGRWTYTVAVHLQTFRAL
jgi:hypothetical protein